MAREIFLDAKSRTRAEEVFRIDAGVRRIQNKIGRATLWKHFPNITERGKFFSLLEDAVRLAQRASNSPMARDELLDWPEWPVFLRMWNELRASESRILDAVKREKRRYWLGIVGMALTVMGIALAAIRMLFFLMFF